MVERATESGKQKTGEEDAQKKFLDCVYALDTPKSPSTDYNKRDIGKDVCGIRDQQAGQVETACVGESMIRLRLTDGR